MDKVFVGGEKARLLFELLNGIALYFIADLGKSILFYSVIVKFSL